MAEHKPSSFRDYFIALFVASVLAVLFSCYLFIRRGYFFDAPTTADMLFVPNKAIASVGIALLALTFLIGPITRYFDRFDKWLGLRKEIGIVAAFLIALHGVISYFLLPKKFPQEWISLSSLEFATGLAGAAVLVFLFVISFRKMIALVGASRWWFLQRWGLRITVVLAVIHVFYMKWAGWMKWLDKGGGVPTAELANPWLPALAVLVSMFVAWVVIVRLYELLFLFKNIGFASKEISGDPILRARGRRFFLASFAALMIASVFVVLRWAA